LLAQNLKLNVVQVQQWLTDISATRAAAGFDDGFGEAEANASLFLEGLAEFESHFRQINDTANLKRVTEIRNSFNNYHAEGKKMAEAYISGGPEAGNLLMGDFDVAAEGLQEQLEPFIEQQISQLTGSIDFILASVDRFLFNCVLGVVYTVLLCGLVAWFVTRSVTHPLNKLITALRDIAEGEGDLTQRVDESSKDELGEVGRWFNAFIGKVQELVREVATSVNEVAATATQIAATSEQMDRGMQEQASQTTLVSAAVEEMNATVTEVAGKSSSAAGDADTAGQQATDGGQIVHQTIESMSTISQVVNESAEAVAELGKRGEQIGEIINVINDIADQTNLLALNAAIEAARAGEHGRGFAVVADEVRKLAERTTTATEEVGDSIKAIQDETTKAVERMNAGTESVGQGVELAEQAGDALQSIVESSQGVELAEQAGDALQSIVESSKGVASMIQSIASAASEQASATEDIARNVETINSVSRQSSEATSQSALAASQLSAKSEHLKSIVGRFKIEGGRAA
jgi:methyl-accepting chemotaxis protein